MPPHLYDVKPLEDTLTKFVDFRKINEQYRKGITDTPVSVKDAKRMSLHTDQLFEIYLQVNYSATLFSLTSGKD